MPGAGALLHIGTEIDAAVEAEFNRWCEGHVAANLALPGFVDGRRFARVASGTGIGDHPSYLTLYRLEDASALETDAYANHDQSVPASFASHLSFQRAVYRELYGAEGV